MIRISTLATLELKEEQCSGYSLFRLSLFIAHGNNRLYGFRVIYYLVVSAWLNKASIRKICKR